MKKILLTLTLAISSLVNAQDGWKQTIFNGLNHETVEFKGIKAFNSKLYFPGDSAGVKISLFSSATGDTTNPTEEINLYGKLQGGTETGISSIISNSNYLFLGSSATSYSSATSQSPQVYRGATDGSYMKYGTIDYTTLPSDNMIDTGSSPNISIAIWHCTRQPAVMTLFTLFLNLVMVKMVMPVFRFGKRLQH